MRTPVVSPKRYRTLTLVALVLVSIIIVTGAGVRLSGSGLGCNDWPNCTKSELIAVTNKNQAIEQLNRLFTGLVSIGVMAAVLGSLWRAPRREDLLWLSWGLVGGVILQAVIGGVSVLLKLKWQAVAVHFLASIVLVAVGLMLHRRAAESPGPYRLIVSVRTRNAARVVLGLATWVVCAGTLVTAAGPHGGDAKATRLSWTIAHVARLHGVSVMVLIAAILGLFVLLRAENAPRESLLTIEALLAIGVIQGAIGYYQYFNNIPVIAVGFHVAGAVCVFGAALWLQFTLREATGSETMPA